MHEHHYNLEEKFDFTSKLKKKIGVVALVGVVLFGLGVFLSSLSEHKKEHHISEQSSSSHHEASTVFPNQATPHSKGEALLYEKAYAKTIQEGEKNSEHHPTEHHTPNWIKRIFADLWINNVFFAGIGLIGVFFYAIQYVVRAGWSASIIRVPMALGNWLPIAGILMLGIFLVGHHDLFHWTHMYLYDKNDPRYDAIIDGKKTYLNLPFYLIRMVLCFGLWFLLYRFLRKQSLQEDLNPDLKFHKKSIRLAAVFLIIFAITSAVSAWDWILSIDTHWFSTMFGWYVFASWFVSGIAIITLLILFLKERGYLQMVNHNHLHDLGKFLFAFSIFWTYVWFAQFMLIYYANIPEEGVYFFQRLMSDRYAPIFFINLILNFFLPFLVLMTRDAKRQAIFLKIVCTIILVGHWLDFYLMVTPGVMQQSGGFGFMEIGSAIVFGCAFLWMALSSLAKVPLLAKNHPMMEESLHHHI